MLNERNEKIDELGRRLTRQNSLSDNDLEQIVAAPQMWQNVRRQIEVEKSSRRERFDVISSWQKVFGVRQIALKATFAAICVVGSIFGLGIFVSQLAVSDSSGVADLKNVIAPRFPAESVKSDVVTNPKSVEFVANQTPQSKEDVLKPTQIKFTSEKSSRSNKIQTVVNKRVARNVKSAENYVAAKRKTSKTPNQMPNDDVEEQSEFYALSFAGNSNANEMKQIVRVNLSPAALIKLGVSNSLATIDNSVTADLLLGEDGSPQAIRFIR
ncbi:MAG: hypothetical protein H7Z37_18735 [Pyrinomonadaceae bacterium]|nr:hypothetical protein [Pyrinomonadaceae bacterium]